MNAILQSLTIRVSFATPSFPNFARMKHFTSLLMAVGAAALLAGSCTSAPKGKPSEADNAPAPLVPVRLGGNDRIIGGAPEPSAVVYRTDGDYADNVPVNVSASGRLLSYPAPCDLRGSEPIAVADGYLLDRRGIGPNTVFTRYTYAAYSALPEAPAPDSIMAAIIPGSCVTASITLPMTLTEALADTAAVNTYIRQHLQ